MTSLVLDDVNTDSLMQYYYSILFGESETVKPAALCGLAVLGEPVLLDIDKAASVENLSIEDYMFLALSYAKLGETPQANTIFTYGCHNRIEKLYTNTQVNLANSTPGPGLAYTLSALSNALKSSAEYLLPIALEINL